MQNASRDGLVKCTVRHSIVIYSLTATCESNIGAAAAFVVTMHGCLECVEIQSAADLHAVNVFASIGQAVMSPQGACANCIWQH